MHPELTADQDFFRDTARRFLDTETPLTRVRELYESPDGFDRSWWRQAAELGWTSLFVPEPLGGGSLSGRPTCDAVLVAEEMGRLVAPGPFLTVNVVAAAIAWSGTDEQQATILPALMSGETIAAWAYGEPAGRWAAPSMTTTADVTPDSVILNGTKAYVEAVGVADLLLVVARTGDGLTQVIVPTSAPGVTVRRGRSVDMTRRFGRVQFDDVRVPVDAVVGSAGNAHDAIGRQVELALALQCAEMVGVADRTLEFTLEYGRDRFAFGRPIVSFQALKHRIADMTVRLEGAKAVTDALAASIDGAEPPAAGLASVAKAYVGEHCADLVDDCVQLTGGIGVTWEHDIHLYNRRVTVDRAVFGTPEEHKQHLAVALAERGAI